MRRYNQDWKFALSVFVRVSVLVSVLAVQVIRFKPFDSVVDGKWPSEPVRVGACPEVRFRVTNIW